MQQQNSTDTEIKLFLKEKRNDLRTLYNSVDEKLQSLQSKAEIYDGKLLSKIIDIIIF